MTRPTSERLVTEAALQAALAGYSGGGASGGITQADLTAALAPYAKTSVLSGYVPTSTLSSYATTTSVPTSIASYNNSTGNLYNVIAYGAKGDGSTDDRTAIQAALDACFNAGGGTVLFPAGKTYMCSNYITIKSKTRVLAYGATIKAKTNTINLVMIENTAIPAATTNFTSYTSVTVSGVSQNFYHSTSVEGGTWDGNGTYVDTNTVNPLGSQHNIFSYRGGHDHVLKDVTMQNPWGGHHMEFDHVERGRVINCVFKGFRVINKGTSGSPDLTDNVEAIQLDMMDTVTTSTVPCSDIVVDGCYFGASTELPTIPRAFGTHSTEVVKHVNIKFINNYIKSSTDTAVRVYGWHNVTITNNTILNPGGDGIQCQTGDLATTTNSVANTFRLVVANNIVYTAASYGINISGDYLSPTTAYYYNAVVANNVIHNTKGTAAIRATYATRINIVGNQIDNADLSSHGIMCSNSNNASVKDNMVTNAHINGIYMDDCNNSHVAGNYVYSPGQDGINFDNTSSSSSAIGNYVVDAVRYAYVAAGASVATSFLSNVARLSSVSTHSGSAMYITSDSTSAYAVSNDFLGHGSGGIVGTYATTPVNRV